MWVLRLGAWVIAFFIPAGIFLVIINVGAVYFLGFHNNPDESLAKSRLVFYDNVIIPLMLFIELIGLIKQFS